MNYKEIYKKIIYEIDEINKIKSAKFFAKTSVEMNTIEYELSKQDGKYIII